jgi:hypothetical protein
VFGHRIRDDAVEPTTARTSATSAKVPSSNKLNRRGAIDPDNACSIVITL